MPDPPADDQNCNNPVALLKLNPEHFPNCFLARSHPSDVARVEHLAPRLHDGPRGRRPRRSVRMAPADAHAKMRELFKGCMKGRTLYVVPYCMGPIDSPYSRCGVGSPIAPMS
jgi:phosphoenolpyruvate carboxykinase (GTP)